MKKIILAALLLVVSNKAAAFQGFLENEAVIEQYKYCSYSNGKIITIRSYKLCPLSIK